MLGIMGAMPAEIDYLCQRLEPTQPPQTVWQRQFYSGRLYDQNVVIVQSGIGKVRATITAAALLQHFGVQGLIFTGVAGALRPGLKTGDVVVAHEGYEHDFGTARPEGFIAGLDFMPDDGHRLIVARPDLCQLATTQPGRVATGDVFVADPGLNQRIYAQTEADVVEMEGAAVLRLAVAADIPCVLIRTVSDGGDTDEFLDFFEQVVTNSGRYVEKILTTLSQAAGT